jgi:hypothetical protein
MRHSKIGFLAATFLCAAATIGTARAETTFNFLVSPEFGRGFGAGIEIGGANKLTLGAGTGLGLGYSSLEGFVAAFEPGVTVGYKRYLGRWYLGPSLGVNRTYRLIPANIEGYSSVSALVDGGYRWQWKNKPSWNTRLGLGGGVQGWPGRELTPTVGLTASIGFGL